jgi:hypothetical protein
MNVDGFHELYVAELQELRSVEEQLVQALPNIPPGGDPSTA